MKEQCPVCGSTVDNVSGVCPVCGSVLPSQSQPGASASGNSVSSDQDNPAGATQSSEGLNLMQGAGSQPDGYGTPNGSVQPGGYGTSDGYVQPGGYGTPNGSVQPGGYGMPNSTVQPGNYMAPNGTVQPGGVYGGQYQQPYNYQNPNGTGPAYSAGAPMRQEPKKALFSILSLVCSLLSFITCCIPWIGLILGIAAIAFAIVALVKKQSKAPAVIGMIIGIIGMLMALVGLIFNLVMKSQIGTGLGGMFKQMFEAQSVGVTELEDVIFLNPADNQYYALYSDGTYETSEYGSGEYSNYSFVDYYSTYSNSDAVTYGVMYVMNQGYEIKDITILDFPDASYMFIVPSDFQPGDTIYYVEYPDDYTDIDGYNLVTVYTEDLSSYGY